MRKKVLIGMILLTLLLPTALAEICEGTTVAGKSVAVLAQADGTLANLEVMAGQYVSAGDLLGAYQTEKVYAQQDGTVALLNAEEGSEASGTVLEIAPLSQYEIYCTAEDAYESPETMLVHGGEMVYAQCTKDGTHLAVGIVTQMDGNDYHVVTLGGELYVGETVYLYRDEECSDEACVGIGTVVNSDPVACESNGYITKMCVSVGEIVERGELLYEFSPVDDVQLTAPVSGIVSEVNASDGARVREGDVLLTIVPTEDIVVEVSADETLAASLSVGDGVQMLFASDADENGTAGTIVAINEIAANGQYRIQIQPEDTTNLRLGMTVTVSF